MQLPNIEQRLKRLIDRYANHRYGLIPIRYTGSLQDLRNIVNSVNGRPSSVSTMMTSDLATFTEAEYNEWCKMFQEYWLIMLQAVEELREQKLPSYATTLTRDSYLTLDRLLNLFEQDTTGIMERDDTSASQMFRRMTFENQYMSRRLIEKILENAQSNVIT